MTESSVTLWGGVDLGGTGTRFVIVDGRGTIIAGETVPTSTFDVDAIDRLATFVSGLVPEDGELAGVGVGASGPVDLSTGQIRNPDTLPQFMGFDVAGGLEKRLGTPIWLDNDAVVAGLAEVQWGTVGESRSVLCVTLGTGIGAVLISAGLPVRASDGQHPEGGHIPVPGSGNPCYCGLAQCWEQVGSRTALDRLQKYGGVSEGQLWDIYGDWVASGLVTLLTLYHPSAVVIGGSVARHWDRLEAPLRISLSRSREFGSQILLCASQLGDRAGALGAALLPQRRIGWHAGLGIPR
jgi:glucokinase